MDTGLGRNKNISYKPCDLNVSILHVHLLCGNWGIFLTSGLPYPQTDFRLKEFALVNMKFIMKSASFKVLVHVMCTSMALEICQLNGLKYICMYMLVNHFMYWY